MTSNVKKSMKQLAQEPLEMGKVAGEQVGLTKPAEVGEPQNREGKKVDPQLEEKEKSLQKKFLEAHRQELGDIERETQGQERQRKTQIREDFGSAQEESSPPAVEIPSKRRRNFFAGVKAKIKKLQTRAETRQPPTG